MTPSHGSKQNLLGSSGSYRGYAGLPPLVGLETMEGAPAKGWTAQSCGTQVKYCCGVRQEVSIASAHAVLSLSFVVIDFIG